MDERNILLFYSFYLGSEVVHSATFLLDSKYSLLDYSLLFFLAHEPEKKFLICETNIILLFRQSSHNLLLCLAPNKNHYYPILFECIYYAIIIHVLFKHFLKQLVFFFFFFYFYLFFSKLFY